MKNTHLFLDVFLLVVNTHLDCSITDAEVFGNDYTVYRKDRAGNGARHGGSVSIATKKGMIASIRENQDLPSELLFVEMITEGNKKLTTGIFYRPADSDLKPLEDLRTCLSSITTTDLLIIGDFNLSEFDWTTNHPTKASEHHNLLSYIIQDNFLYQLVEEPTRENNILDLVLTTNIELINDLEVGEPFSDHHSITFTVNTCPYQQRISKKEIKISPWYYTLEQEDINANWKTWKDLYFASVNESIPKYHHKRKNIAPCFLFIYLLFYSFRWFRFGRFACFGGFVSVVSFQLFRSFRFGRFARFVSVVSFRCFGF